MPSRSTGAQNLSCFVFSNDDRDPGGTLDFKARKFGMGFLGVNFWFRDFFGL